MYLTEDGERAVPDGHPEARHLLCAAGGEVSRTIADRYHLLDEPEPEPAAEPEPEAKQAATPANKARRPAGNKGD